jgi:serine/threonine protein kinase
VASFGRIPEHLLATAKKYKQFYKSVSTFFSTYDHELIRAKDSCFGNSLQENSLSIRSILKDRVDSDCINLICQCLQVDPQLRIKAEDACVHPWFEGLY